MKERLIECKENNKITLKRKGKLTKDISCGTFVRKLLLQFKL